MQEKKKASPGAMAWLVGEALRAGGIKLIQAKEKFGSVRVYVSMPSTDAARKHYREVYMTAMQACPELADNLRGSADYSEWLFATEKDLDAEIAVHVSRSPNNALDSWSPRFALARQLIRGEDTSDYLDADTEIEEVNEPKTEVTVPREQFEAACAAVAWACVQSGGGGWTELYTQMNAALNNKTNK
jgi:hypothetical protein